MTVLFILGFGKPARPKEMPLQVWDYVQRLEPKNPSPRNRLTAAWAFANTDNIRHETAIPFLAKWLREDPNASMRRDMATALGKMADEKVVSHLFGALRDSSVAKTAAEGLYSVGAELRAAAEKGADLKEKHAKALVEVHQLLDANDSPRVVESAMRAALEGREELKSVEGASKFMRRLRDAEGHSL